MFANNKPNSTVGLEIETGSIAATEVRNGGSSEIARTAIASLPPGVINEGEVQNPEALSSELRSFFSEYKLSKTVRHVFSSILRFSEHAINERISFDDCKTHVVRRFTFCFLRYCFPRTQKIWVFFKFTLLFLFYLIV